MTKTASQIQNDIARGCGVAFYNMSYSAKKAQELVAHCKALGFAADAAFSASTSGDVGEWHVRAWIKA